ncbi:MFS transporter [Simiduia litorea]|uniref:MFS transporter n=1 Tax=Simiduia litorea TaxID=1435348 RepID=UPI0036F3989F
MKPCPTAPIPYWRLSSFYFFYFALVGVLVPYWTLYLQYLGYSPYEIGVIAGLLMATRVLAPNIWGWLADRHGNRLGIIRLGSFAAALCFSGIFVSTRYQWLVWVVLSFSFFWNAVLAQFEVLTLALLAPQTGRYGLIRQWGSVGFIAMVVLLGYLFEWLSISHLPVVVLTLLLLIWLSSLLVPDLPRQASTRPPKPFWVKLKQPAALLFFLVCFLLQVSHGPYYTFYSIYLHDLGYSAGVIGWLWALGVIAEIILFWFASRLLVSASLLNLLIIALLLTAVRWYLIGAHAENLSLLLIAQLLHAASFGLAHAVAIEWVGKTFCDSSPGQGQALYSSLSFGAGGALGAVLSGSAWQWSAEFTFFGASIVAVLGVLAAVSLKFVRIRD